MRTKYLYTVLICLLIVGCSKKKESESYGVSICAPSISSSAASAFSDEQFEFFKMANGLSIAACQAHGLKDTTGENIAFSSLLLIGDLCREGLERDYLETLFRFCNFSDTSFERLSSSFNRLQEIFHQVDSSLVFESRTDSLEKGTTLHSQRFALPLLYEEALNKQKGDFHFSDTSYSQRNFFSLYGEFDYTESEEETAVLIPVGNASYSLMLILPKQRKAQDYAKDFSESRYSRICEELRKTKTRIVFPAFENFASQSLISLPSLPSDSLVAPKQEQKLRFEMQILQPNEALLQSLDKPLEEKIIQHSQNEEQLVFNRPFLFVLRGSNSRAIIFQGIYLR